MQQKTGRKGHTMRRKYFGEECVFEFVWQHCDNDGIWDGDAESVAADFHVSEDEAHEMLSDLANRGLIERLYPGAMRLRGGANGTSLPKTNWRCENRCL